MSDDLRAAVAAGALGSEDSYRALLQSIVEVVERVRELEGLPRDQHGNR